MTSSLPTPAGQPNPLASAWPPPVDNADPATLYCTERKPRTWIAEDVIFHPALPKPVRQMVCLGPMSIGPDWGFLPATRRRRWRQIRRTNAKEYVLLTDLPESEADALRQARFDVTFRSPAKLLALSALCDMQDDSQCPDADDLWEAAKTARDRACGVGAVTYGRMWQPGRNHGGGPPPNAEFQRLVDRLSAAPAVPVGRRSA